MHRGFSLLEVLLGSILFAMIVVSLAGIWGVHARILGHSRDRMVANFICAQVVENCITAGFRGVDKLAGQSPPESLTTTINRMEQTCYYTTDVEVAAHTDPALAATVKVVTVKVSFAEKSAVGGRVEVVYKTMLSDI